MAITFNSDEVFEMAIRIESNGAAFYRKAAGMQSDAENKKFLEGLAAMEDQHQKIFAEMRKTLTEADKGGTVFDPYDEASQYLAAMADIQHCMQHYAKKAGLKVSCHQLRHTMATQLLNADADLLSTSIGF